MKESWPTAANLVIDVNTFPLRIGDFPTQPNGYDCGVYLLLYLDALLAMGSLPVNAAEIVFPTDFNSTAARQEMRRIIHVLSSLSPSTSSSSASPSSSRPAASPSIAVSANLSTYFIMQV